MQTVSKVLVREINSLSGQKQATIENAIHVTITNIGANAFKVSMQNATIEVLPTEIINLNAHPEAPICQTMEFIFTNLPTKARIIQTVLTNG